MKTLTDKATAKQRLFSANALSSSPETIVDNGVTLPGWSHCSEAVKIHVSWYPFEEYQRKIYFHAQNRTQAAKQCTRAGLHIRDLDGGRPALDSMRKGKG